MAIGSNGGAFSPFAASSAQERGAMWVPPTGTRCTVSELIRTACQSVQSSILVATGRSRASQAMLGPSAPSRPQQASPRFSGISRVRRISPGAMTLAPGVLSDRAWTGAWIPRASASPGSDLVPLPPRSAPGVRVHGERPGLHEHRKLGPVPVLLTGVDRQRDLGQ